jgi:VCBS repeat-containing protein
LNFVGKFDANLPVDGWGAHVEAHTRHVEASAAHVPADAIIVPDAHLLFEGDYKRSGVDLVLSNDERELVLHDYFKGEKRAALSSPDGAYLTGDIVNALTGHVEYAQAAGNPSSAQVIGHVTKLTGTATAIRNGVSIILNQGDNVEKGDVIQSGSASTVGVTFIDGSVFGLSSNARMVLNEMVYDPNGSNNSSLISLVAGTISFVAGETAKHGDMKVDTPVATMGIRGTAVLVAIDFDIPGQNGAPSANFQVLVEPDGSTGSYILFDKATLAPIATVNQAGQQININNGTVSVTASELSPDVQKLITDVFSQKFTDNSNQNTKTTTAQTDTVNPQLSTPIKLADGATATPVVLIVSPTNPTIQTAPPGPDAIILPTYIDQPPAIAAVGGSLSALPYAAGSSIIDSASGKISFADVNRGDRPTVTTEFVSFTYQTAQHQDVTAMLNAQQLADIKALEVPLVVIPDPGNNNVGSASWTYNIPNADVDFLAPGETLTLSYLAEVDSIYASANLTSSKLFSVTIVGVDDLPAIVATSAGFAAGNTALDHASGTITFTEVNLTDRPVVSTAFTSFTLTDASHHALTLTAQQLADVAAVEVPLTLVQTGNTNNGSATWTYSLADSNFDFLTTGEILTLTYTATVDDGHGGVVTQPITVTITGTNDTPVIVGETDPSPQSIVLAKSPIVLGAGANINSLGLHTETFNSESAGSVSNNGFGYGDFYSVALGATFTGSGDAGVVNGSSGVSVAPFVGPLPGQADITNYLSIGANGTETITFATEQDVFGLYWGSVDSYNTISFYNGAQLVGSYTGAEISPLLSNGAKGSFSSNGYVEFPDLAAFNKVVLATGDENAFEVDNISAGFVSQSLASPITGTLTVSDPVIGDTLTASVIGNGVVTYDGSATLPSDAKIITLIDAAAVTFDSVQTNGGLDVLHWTYNPTNIDLDFLQPGDTLTITFEAQVNNGHLITGDQPLTVTFIGATAPVLTVPESAETIGVGEAAKISGIHLSESGNTSGEIFTVTLTDSHGVLSANTVGDGDTAIAVGTTLTITGSLSDVSSDLATLTDTNGTVGSDPITLTANDSRGNSAALQTVSVTVNDVPVITVPSEAQTIGVSEATKISGIHLSETGNTSGRIFTVTLTDSHGVLSANTVGDGDMAIVSGTTLTITGSLSDVNSDLATLTDTNGTVGPDPITLTATDSLGSSAAQQTLAVTIQPAVVPATTLTFDNLPLSVESSIPNGYGGLDWSNFYYLDSNTDVPISGYSHGTVSGPDVAYNAYGEQASISGTTFNFIGADLTAAWNNGLVITVDGYDHNVLVDQQTVVVNTNTPTWFDLDFNGITDLVFSSSGGVSAGYDGSGTQFAMDNFTYSAIADPDLTISSGGSIQISSSSANTVLFSGSTGILVLDNPSNFTGKIAGISGSSDILDLKGFDTNTTAATGSGSYDSANGTTTLTVTDPSQHLTTPITLVGDYSNSTWAVTDDGHGGVDIVDPPPAHSPTIASGATLEIASGVSLAIASPVATGESVTFHSSTGSLTLDTPSSFDGVISGFTGDGTLAGSDQIDLKGISYHSSSFTESYNSTTDTLTVSDGANDATLHFIGTYQAANFSFASDGNGGTIVYDPPVSNSPDGRIGAGQARGGSSDGFVFKFPNVDQKKFLDSHPAHDAHQYSASSLESAQAALSEPHDARYGTTPLTPDGHEPIAVAGILKAQLLANDFHFV